MFHFRITGMRNRTFIGEWTHRVSPDKTHLDLATAALKCEQFGFRMPTVTATNPPGLCTKCLGLLRPVLLTTPAGNTSLVAPFTAREDKT